MCAVQENALTEGAEVNGFRITAVVPIEEMNACGIYAVHRKTGCGVFHVRNADPENLFAFAFSTPPEDSRGTAHILEHAVLCGSQQFPLKDPFIVLSGRSVKTFLNAMTYPDKTVFPASSVVEADYFHLLSVYGDAVFFPLLEEWTFLQEGRRFELCPDGSLAVQGVVFNEMKGNYSSFDSVAGDWTVRCLFEGTPYAYDSGGEPACIPDLTYEEFRAFHARHYHPSNCRIFLYGNI
ncbi:MAG: insulinase family protein, partial [Spirochaetes bacterium]|nr:insulinase family protein [Candidatus Avitreponema avistercoris]